jgi:hypothetical protein
MSSYARYMITVTDLNVHIDDAECDNAVKPQLLHESFDLRDIVGGQRTHVRDHQLDVIIARQEQSVASVHVDPPSLFSDHSLIVVTLDGVCTSSQSHTVLYVADGGPSTSKRSLLICRQSRMVTDPPSNVTELFDCYDNTLKSLLDKHEPLCEAPIHLNRSAPLYDVDCRRFKAHTRRLERAFSASI